MEERRCFIQLHHPGGFPQKGGRHTRDCGACWHFSCIDRRSRTRRRVRAGAAGCGGSCSSGCGGHQHQRKFLQLDGRWIAEDGTEQSGELWAWGEWEAESSLVREFERAELDPRQSPYLWRPRYQPKTDYWGLHNTDPFIFGPQFLYSNCGQLDDASNSALRHLAPGSVVVFGSRFKGEWVLDTVLVVARRRSYRAREARLAFQGLPKAFLEVAAGPIADNRARQSFALYHGATPQRCVDGMFSFFPARPAGGESGFRRPCIELPSAYFNRGLRRSHKQTRDAARKDLVWLWESLVSQVRDSGLVLGTYAAVPRPGRNARA